jgi:hypothetical protein
LVEQPDGTRHVIKLENVQYVPEFEDTLFSVGAAPASALQISDTVVNILLTYKGTVINFNILDKCSAGIIAMTKMFPFPKYQASDVRAIPRPILDNKHLLLNGKLFIKIKIQQQNQPTCPDST